MMIQNMIKIMMRAVCILYIWSSYAVELSDQEKFIQANHLYNQKQYEYAIEMYESITSKGSAVWFNIGNCYYQLQEPLNALVSWQRARSGASYHETNDIISNSKKAYEMLNMSYEASARYYFDLLPPSWWQIGILIWLAVLMILFCTYYRRMTSYYKQIALCMSIVLGMFGSYYLTYWVSHPYGYIMHHDVWLRSGPGDQYEQQSSCAYAALFDVQLIKKEWYKIICNDKIGWVNAKDVQVIDISNQVIRKEVS